MKKFASLCLLFVCLLLILFLSGSPLIQLSRLNQWLFPNNAVIGSPVVKAEFADDFATLGGNEGTDPLRVEVLNNGCLAVYTWQPDAPGSPNYVYENRYFDSYCWGSNLFLSVGSEQVHLYSDYYQDLPRMWDNVPSGDVDIGLGVQSVIDHSIVTTWSLLDDACTLQQTITYLPGSSSISKTFTITHTGSQEVSLTNLRFMHGGDIYFGLEGYGFFDAANQTITAQNRDLTIGGSFAMKPDPASPLDSWFAGDLVEMLDATDVGSLPGTVANYSEDISAQLQWNRDVLAAGETWTITLIEQFSGFDPETAATTTTTQTSEATTVPAATTTGQTAETTTVPVATTTTAAVETTTSAVETTTTAAVETTLTSATTTTEMSQTATSTQVTTSSATDETLPATGEDGSCHFITGGMMLLIAALFCWFKRLQSCH